METKVLNNQSLFDLAIQTGGSVESVVGLIVDNDLSITTSLEPGDILSSPEVTENQTKGYYQTKGLTPATFSSVTETKRLGIGNMTIQQDFTVNAK